MDYMSFFPSAARALPRFSALARAVLAQAEDLIAVISQLNAAYSLDSAAGAALDAFGASVMLPRPEGLGDEDYRVYLKAKLKLFTWDGSNDTAQEILSELFPGSTIRDNLDGTVTVHTVSALQREQGLYPLPAGVKALIV